ncbi:hypothetical protein CK203_044540 [Vitis vinifera]|uniref:F-box domain-containing protein n=1 Tax=Vitis vinifera TaxID=29760 RepID=A0A438HB92_VITVI|nr:hypothetical protein CK203_044540 [Vitis vinifera]
MWSNLPFDLLANIFSFLPADSLALASSVCKHWHNNASLLTRPRPLGLAIRRGFLPHAIRPVASIGGLVLLRSTTSTTLQLAICNLFTKRYWSLPMLNIARTNPAVGVVFGLDESPDVRFSSFRVYVAGGMSEAPSGGAAYEPTLEMYDSWHDRWDIIGRMPVEFALAGAERADGGAARICGTSAVERQADASGWHVQRGACIWELGEGDTWELVEKIPIELGMRLLGVKGSWESTKCVGSDGAVCLYRDLGQEW